MLITLHTVLIFGVDTFSVNSVHWTDTGQGGTYREFSRTEN